MFLLAPFRPVFKSVSGAAESGVIRKLSDGDFCAGAVSDFPAIFKPGWLKVATVLDFTSDVAIFY